MGECSSDSSIAAVLRLQQLQRLSLLRVNEHFRQSLSTSGNH
jgi:hypothetical protein